MTVPGPCFLAAAALAAAALGAQSGNGFAVLDVPGGTTITGAASLGKLVTYRDGGILHVFSAVSRRWSPLAANPGAVVRLTNDLLCVQDGAVWTAFGATRGVFAPLAVSPQAQILNPAGQDNDAILLVRDGGQLHAFSGFTGTWTSRAVGATPAWSVKRNVALLADGNVLAAMDAYSGQWHDLPLAAPPAWLSADGTAGIAFAPPLVHGFSAARAVWQTAPAPTGATFVRDDDWALWFDGSAMLGYSGLQGRFESAPVGAIAPIGGTDLFGLVDTVLGPVPFSAVRGSFGPPLGLPGATVVLDGAVAVATDALGTHGYSALRNSVATLPGTPAVTMAAGVVATALDANTQVWHLFGADRGTWHAAPTAVLPAGPQLTTTCVLLPTAAGLEAFSPRTGQFVPLAGSGLSPVTNASSAVAAAWDATHLHAFDPRTDRWRSVPRPNGATVPVMQIWRTTLQAADGAFAFGYGAQNGEWSTTPLPELFAAGRANSESGSLLTTNRLLAYSALPDLAGWPQFPAFRRVLTAGCTARFALLLDAGGMAFVAAGLPAAPTTVPGLGDLLLAPNSLAVRLLLPTPGEVVQRLALPVPAHPGLAGFEIGLQPLLVPGAGPARLGEVTALPIW